MGILYNYSQGAVGILELVCLYRHTNSGIRDENPRARQVPSGKLRAPKDPQGNPRAQEHKDFLIQIGVLHKNNVRLGG